MTRQGIIIIANHDYQWIPTNTNACFVEKELQSYSDVEDISHRMVASLKLVIQIYVLFKKKSQRYSDVKAISYVMVASPKLVIDPR